MKAPPNGPPSARANPATTEIGRTMHKPFCVSMALAALAIPLFAQPAAAIEYPWCAQYGGMDDAGKNCGFSTLAQCMATVSGIGGGCVRNGFYEGSVERPAKRAHKQKSHAD